MPWKKCVAPTNSICWAPTPQNVNAFLRAAPNSKVSLSSASDPATCVTEQLCQRHCAALEPSTRYFPASCFNSSIAQPRDRHILQTCLLRANHKTHLPMALEDRVQPVVKVDYRWHPAILFDPEDLKLIPSQLLNLATKSAYPGLLLVESHNDEVVPICYHQRTLTKARRDDHILKCICINLKTQDCKKKSMTPTKEVNNDTLMDPEEMKIYEITNRKFWIILLKSGRII